MIIDNIDKVSMFPEDNLDMITVHFRQLEASDV